MPLKPPRTLRLSKKLRLKLPLKKPLKKPLLKLRLLKRPKNRPKPFVRHPGTAARRYPGPPRALQFHIVEPAVAPDIASRFRGDVYEELPCLTRN